MQQRQQIIDKCKSVIARAKELWPAMDLSRVQITFDLRGRAAGQARRRGGTYSVRFNGDMLSREAFDHVLNNTVPHEFAHIICYMNPALGRNHDSGWQRVCALLGGNSTRCHKEEIVYGKGYTYEYRTDNGQTVRVGDKHHRYIQGGGTLRFRRGKGNVVPGAGYSIVGHQGRTLQTPIVKQPVNHPAQIEAAVRAPVLLPAESFVLVSRTVQPATRPVQPTAHPGESKAAVSRRLMLSGFNAGHSYETIINAMIAANGYDRQLARGTFKANAPKIGIPTNFYA